MFCGKYKKQVRDLEHIISVLKTENRNLRGQLTLLKTKLVNYEVAQAKSRGIISKLENKIAEALSNHKGESTIDKIEVDPKVLLEYFSE